MTIGLKFYDDVGLTIPSTSISVSQGSDGASAPVDRTVYLGSNTPNVLYLDSTSPDVAPIYVNIVDAVTGSGVQASHVKLAVEDPENLDTAVGGAALNVGTSNLTSGVAYAIPIYVRIDTPALTPGTYTDVSLATSSVDEWPA